MGSVGRSRVSAARPQMGRFFLSRLLCRHRTPPFLCASKPDHSDAPHLIDGHQRSSQSRTCIVRHVHLSIRHRRRRAFPPRRFVCPRSFAGRRAGMMRGPLWVRRIWGRGSADGVGRPIARERGPPADGTGFFIITIVVQASDSSFPLRFQTRSLRCPPPHRWPPAQLSIEDLHRPSCTSFHTPSSPPRCPASQVCLPSLCTCACINPGTGRDVGRSISAWDAPR